MNVSWAGLTLIALLWNFPNAGHDLESLQDSPYVWGWDVESVLFETDSFVATADFVCKNIINFDLIFVLELCPFIQNERKTRIIRFL